MLVLREPIRVDVPHEEGEWIEFCKLTHREIRDARKAGMVENAEQMKIFSAEWITALMSGSKEKAQQISEAGKWDESAFGTDALLSMGVVGWSYAEGKPTDEQMASLDAATAAWAKQAIININKPPSEDEVKKS